MIIFSYTSPASATWRRAESPNFILYGEASEETLRERVLLLEDYDNLLRRITSVDDQRAPNKLVVYVVRGLDDLRIVRPGLQNGVGGFYAATPGAIAAFVDSRAYAGENEILFHEYTHHFMLQYAASAYPAWYIEGFAEYFSTARFRDRTIDVGNYSQGRGYSIVAETWLPMARVMFDRAEGLNRDLSAQYYAQAWLATHYFYSNADRQRQLVAYLDAISDGVDPRAALERATGMDGDAFHRAMRDYIRGGRISYRRMGRVAAAPPPVTVTTLPRSADDLLLYHAALQYGPSDDEQAEYLRRIRAAAARHADDPYARRVLAHAEALFGDPAIADGILEALLAQSPGDVELLYLRGLRHFIAAEKGDHEEQSRQARLWFGRAYRADGNHYQTLYRYAQSLRGRDNFISENTANILLLAHQIAPQVVDIRMTAAQMLIHRNDLTGAEALLRPIAASPHDSGLAQAAQQMLELARRQASGRGNDTPEEDETTQTPPASGESDPSATP